MTSVVFNTRELIDTIDSIIMRIENLKEKDTMPRDASGKLHTYLDGDKAGINTIIPSNDELLRKLKQLKELREKFESVMEQPAFYLSHEKQIEKEEVKDNGRKGGILR